MEVFQENIGFQDIVLDAIREPLFAVNERLQIMVWNKAVATLTGMPAGAVIGRPVDEVLLCQDGELLAHLRAAKTFFQFIKIGDRSYRTLLEPIYREKKLAGFKGRLYATADGVLSNLPRRYLEEAVRLSPVSMVVFNPDGTIMFSNNAYQKMWGLNKEELHFVNHKYNIFLDKQLERQGIMPHIKKAFRGKAGNTLVRYEVNTASLGRSGADKTYWLLAHLYPVKGADGQVEFVVLHFLDVTDYKKLQEAFTSSQEWINLAIEGGDLGAWEWDIAKGVVTFKDRSLVPQSFELKEPDDLNQVSLFHQQMLPVLRSNLVKLLSGREETVEVEFQARDDEGNWPWFLARGRVVRRDAGGRPLKVAGIHVNIDERKRIEQKIRESETRFKNLVDNAPIGIGIIAEEKLVFMNKKMAEMGEVENREEVLGAPARAFVPDEKRYKIFMERYRMVVEEGKNAPLYTTQLKTVKGNIFDVETTSIPTLYNGKRAMQVLMHDITERKKALQELARSRELLNQLFENAPMGIVLLDEQFNVSNINKGFEELFGFTLKEIKGKSLMDYIVPPELAEEAERLNITTREGQIDYFETYRYSKKGEKIPVLIYALPVQQEGRHFGIYGIYVDIRKRVQAEEELKTRNFELDNFVYKVSHDLRAPLASILGLINLSRLEQDNPSLDYIQLIESQVLKLDHFIRDVLSHSKNLKMSVTVMEIDFENIIEQCFKDLSYLPGADSIERRIQIDKGVFYSDRWRINEIFRNLIGNAIKYRNPEAGTCYVGIRVKKTPKGCTITVSDNGVGISEENLPHIMKMFYRAAENADGSGIGLYIVQKAVEIIRGRISVTSRKGKGTTFTLTLPSLSTLEFDSPGAGG